VCKYLFYLNNAYWNPLFEFKENKSYGRLQGKGRVFFGQKTLSIPFFRKLLYRLSDLAGWRCASNLRSCSRM
jgi:hypothetical protein